MKKWLLLLISLLSLGASAENQHYYFLGRLQTLADFRLELEEDEYGNVMGEIHYMRHERRNAPATFKVFGLAFDEETNGVPCHTLVLAEYDGNKVCGRMFIDMNKFHEFDHGAWWLDDTRYEMEGTISINQPEVSIRYFMKKVPITEASGVYEFTYDSGNAMMPEYGGSLTLYAERQNVAYSIYQVTPNIAEVTNTTSEAFGNYFYTHAGEAWYMVTAYEGVVFVNRLNPDKGPCQEFGMNADIVGAYPATGKQPTGDIVKAFESEKRLSNTLPCSVFDLNEAWMEALGGETTFPDDVILWDIDGDGQKEIIARYDEDRTLDYEVLGDRTVIFAMQDGKPVPLVQATGAWEEISIAPGYIIKNVAAPSGNRNTSHYYRIANSALNLHATKTEALINSYTLDGKTVDEKAFKKQVQIKARLKVEDLQGWRIVPGNEKRNENAARG